MSNLIPYTPYSNGVIIEQPVVKEDTLKSGVVLPDGHKASDYEQTEFKGYPVVSIGPECKQTKVGDLVMFKSYAVPDGFTHDKKTYCVFKEHEIVVFSSNIEVTA